MILMQKWGVVGKGQKNGVFRLSLDRLAMRHCRQIGPLAMDTQAHADTANTQYTQTLVLTGRHVYYTRVRNVGALGWRKAGRGCLRSDRLGGQHGW